MKKLYILILLISGSLFGCYVGPEGPPGYPGRDGLDGLDGLDGEEAYVFEYEFSFTSPDYSQVLSLPSNFTMLDSDVMLVYLLWEVNDGTEIWRALPQTLYLADGVLQYNFDFSRFDALVFLDGTVNLDLLGADFTDNWIARVVVVPAQFVTGRSAVDYSDYNQVKEAFNLSDSKLASDNYASRPK